MNSEFSTETYSLTHVPILSIGSTECDDDMKLNYNPLLDRIQILASNLTNNSTKPIARLLHRSLLPDTARIVKSLLWVIEETQQSNPEYIMIVLDLNRSVDTKKLSKVMNSSKLKLASPDEVLAVTGQRVGNVSPIGHITNLPTLLDMELMNDIEKGQDIIYGGGGEDDYELELTISNLIQLCHPDPIIEDISKPQKKQKSTPVLLQTLSPPPPTPSPSHLTDIQPTDKLSVQTDFNPKRLRDLALSSNNTAPSMLAHYLDTLAIQSLDPSTIDPQTIPGMESGSSRRLPSHIIDAITTDTGKTALHFAAWKGHPGNVQVLLDHGADVNLWSTGSGNYGKTAIFYAITQCRDEVVKDLIRRGALVRIVNNKGQSPRSLAVSHLEEETIQCIEAAEQSEGRREAEEGLMDGLKGWLNFYASHWDGMAYGDLDPRFLTSLDPTKTWVYDDDTNPRAINPSTFQSRREGYISRRTLFPHPSSTGAEGIKTSTAIPPKSETTAAGIEGTTGTDDVFSFKSRRKEIALRKTIHSIVFSEENLHLIRSTSPQTLFSSTPHPMSYIDPILSSESESMSLIGFVFTRRQVSRHLIFFSLIPPIETVTAQQLQLATTPSAFHATLQRILKGWRFRDGDSGTGIQLIVGKTLRGRYGEDSIHRISKTIQLGDLVRVHGRFSREERQVEEGEGLQGSGVAEGRMDFIVSDIHRLSLKNETEPAATEDMKRLDNPVKSLWRERNVSEAEGVVGSETKMGIETKKRGDLPIDGVRFITMESIEETGSILSRAASSEYLRPGVVMIDKEGTEESGEGVGWKEGQAMRQREKGVEKVGVVGQREKEAVEEEGEGVDITVAQDTESLEKFERVSNVLMDLTQRMDPFTRKFVSIGLDCEWQPNRNRTQRPHPVAILQVATPFGIFLLDMIELGTRRTEEREQLNCILQRLFTSSSITKLGFGIFDDMKRLVESYPEMTCFHRWVRVVDVHALAQGLGKILFRDYQKVQLRLSSCSNNSRLETHQNTSSISSEGVSHRKYSGISNAMGENVGTMGSIPALKNAGLSTVCAHLTSYRLNKSQQCSDWEQRPLTPYQVKYAATDSAVLIMLYTLIIERCLTVAVGANTKFSPFQQHQDESYVVIDELSKNKRVKSMWTNIEQFSKQFRFNPPVDDIR